VRDGGRVITKSLEGDKYIRICYDSEGKSHAGEVRTKQKSKKGTQPGKGALKTKGHK